MATGFRHPTDNCESTEDSLAGCHQLLAGVLDAVPDLLVVIDRDFRIRYTNAKGHDEIHTLDPDKRNTCYGRYKLLDAPCADCRALPVFESGAIVEREMVNPADGRLREVRAFPIFDAAGRVEFVVEHVRDITDRRKAEAALADCDQRLRALVDHVPAPVQGYGADGIVTYWNQASERLYGYTAEEALGRRLHELIIPDELQAHFQASLGVARQLAESGEFAPAGELELLRKDGTRAPVYSTHTAICTPGQPPMLFCLDLDLTAQKRAEERLRIMAEMLDDAPSSISVHDFEGRMLYANRRAAEMHGYTSQEFLSLSLDDLDVPEAAALRDERRELLLSNGEASFELEHFHKSGSRVPIQMFVKHVDWGGVPAALMIGTDISERKRAEQQREQLQSQLLHVQKMESIGRLAGGVAHDFNNMLSVILGHAEMALEQIAAEHPVAAHLQQILAAAQRSADLTRQLLAFARRQTVTPTLLDLNETVSGMIKMLERLIGEDLELSWSPGPDLWPIKIDRVQVDQILANLAINARDAMPAGGQLGISTRNAVVRAGGVVTSRIPPGEYVLLTVSDTGTGMDQASLERLFEPFFTTKERGRGTGLGLATIYGIVTQNLGFIEVFSEAGRGTRFEIYLPRQIGTVVRAEPGRPQEATRRGRETLLIVEDEPAILDLTSRTLGRLGYRVLAAGSPAEALSIVGQHIGPIDLLVTDVVMPEMNGRELAEQLIGIHSNLKCLFMSGYPADAIAHRGILNKGVHFLQKPFSMKDLATRVRALMDAEPG